jgi:hypothetical protein
MGGENLDYWPEHVRHVFAAVGKAMGGKRLAPGTLALVPSAHGSIVPDHLVTVGHVTGKEAGHRRGHFILAITGPRIDGRWSFRSGQLETLARLSVSPDA